MSINRILAKSKAFLLSQQLLNPSDEELAREQEYQRSRTEIHTMLIKAAAKLRLIQFTPTKSFPGRTNDEKWQKRLTMYRAQRIFVDHYGRLILASMGIVSDIKEHLMQFWPWEAEWRGEKEGVETLNFEVDEIPDSQRNLTF